MKRYITIALCALTVFGLGSCNKIHEEDFDNAGHSVTFQAQLGNDTRTGLALKFVPDWRETDETKDVHIWEVTGSERLEGEDIKKTIPGAAEGNYEIALFKADFSNMTIIVNPPTDPSSAPATRAGETYVYTSIVASTDANGKYTVPSTQKPDTETLIDPHADFLVGISTQDYSQSQAGKQLDLRFTRPVAISRLSIMNVEDPTIKQVKIYSSDKLTGSASYENVNFENATVSFDNSGSNVITLDYGSGVAMPAEGIFNAYFISLVGTKRITKIEVETNTQTLSKEFEGGKALTFKVPDFKSIAVNMGGSVTPGPGEDQPQNLRFVKGGSTITSDTYDLYNGGTYVSPTVTGAAQGAVLTYSSSDPAVATVSNTGDVTPVGEGETTISVTASAVTGYLAGSAEYTLTVTDSTPDAVDQPLKFMKGGVEITSDTYDLYNGGTYVSPTLTGVAEGATVTWAITCIPEGCATIDADGKVTPVAIGAVVVTATASAVAPLYKQTTKSYDLEIKDTTPVVGPTVMINLEEATELVAGEKYVLVSNGFALVRDGEEASAAAFDATALTVAVPEDLQGNIEWTLERTSGTITRGNEYAFTQGAYFFGIAMNTNPTTYTYTVEVNNGRNVATNISIQDHNISLADGRIFYAGNSSNYYVFYNTTNNGWDNEKVSNTANPAATSKTVLYKLKDMRAAQNPTFSAATAEYDLYEKKWTQAVPTLQNAQGTVTYESSNTAVATVNADGAVTIMTTAKSGDSAVITANAAGNDSYKPGSASYTINIVNTNPNVTRYVKVTSTAGLESGKQYLIVYENGAASKVFKPILDGNTYTASAANAIDAVVSDEKIESNDFADCLVTLEATGSNFFMRAAGSYLYPSQSNLGAESSPTSSRALAITISGGKVTIKRSEYTHYLGFDSYFRRMGSDTGNLALYTESNGTTPEPPTPVAQTLSFDPASVSGKVGETVTAPTLSGAMTTVMYSSSDSSVAEVNASTGALTLKAEGTATITATAAAETVGGVTYAEGTATYTVTVTAADPAEASTYRQISFATGITTGKYLIVNPADAYVFTAVTGNPNAEVVTPVSGAITGAYAAYEFTITNSGSNITIQNASGQYLYYVYTSGSTASRVAYQSTANGTWTPASVGSDANGFDLTWQSGTGTQHIYWSDTFFKIGSQQTGVHLYRLDDGTTPEPPTPVAQTLSFNPTSVSGKVGESVTKPTLTGAMTTVMYSSSNPAVAAVDANNGNLTLNAEGTATITATAAAETVGGVLYAEGTATYTVNVSAADVPPVGSSYYQRVTASSEFVQDGVYVIVNEENGKLFKPILNSSNTNFETTNNTINVTIADGKIASSSAIDACQIVLKNSDGSGRFALFVPSADCYLQVYNGSNFKADAANDYRSTFSVTSAGVASIYRDNSHYIRYSGSNSAFQVGNNSNNIAVYKYVGEGGTTPTPEPPTPQQDPTYTRISGGAELVTGTYIIVEKTDTYLYNATNVTSANNGGYSTIGSTSGITKNGTTITLSDEIASDYEFVFTRTGDNLTIKQVGGTHAGQYMYATNNVSNTYIDFKAEATNFVVDVQANTDYVYFATQKTSTNYTEYLYKKSSDSFFKLGGSGSPTADNPKDAGIYLYKKN